MDILSYFPPLVILFACLHVIIAFYSYRSFAEKGVPTHSYRSFSGKGVPTHETVTRKPSLHRSYPKVFDITSTLPIRESALSLYTANATSGYERRIRRMTDEDVLAEYDDGQCSLENDWLIRAHPSCNNLHEVGLDGGSDTGNGRSSLHLLGKGGSRTAYQFKSGEIDVILKGPHFKNDPSPRMYERQAQDAIILESSNSSTHYLPNIYGFCGYNGLMEFSEGGNIHDYLRGSRYNGGQKDASLSNLDRLRVGHQVASSISAFHDIGGKDNHPAFAHMDICCHQFLFFNGRFKLNDFDLSILLLTDKETGQICPEPSHMKIYKMRTPEEMRLSNMVHGTNLSQPIVDFFDSVKIDVYLMGNLLYSILTDKYIFETQSRKEAVNRLARGERASFFGAESSTDEAVQALVKAVKMCWEDNPEKRPTSKEILSVLDDELLRIDEVYRETGENKIILPKRVGMLPEKDWYKHN